MIKNVLLILFFFSVLKIVSQEVYAISSESKLYKVEEDNTLSYIVTMSLGEIGDIAISPDNKFYGISGKSIYELNISNGNVIKLRDLPKVSYISLVCDNNYNLYSISSDNILYKYSITNDTIEAVKDLGTSTPGDLTFYKGNLLFQSTRGNGFNRHIMAYNIQKKTLSNIMCVSKSENYNFWGLSSKISNCNEGKIIAFDSNKKTYELDIEKGNVVELKIEEPKFYIYGAASNNEYLASTCDSYEFENLECSTLNIEDIADSKEVAVYPNPFYNVLYIESQKKIKTVKFYDLGGRLLKSYNKSEFRLVTEKLKNGVYLIKIQFDNKVIIRKLVKKN
ncbi:T9SS type A sorting domain-containing protein [uncultured Tenacibaculum sp.]|uniref:T9SS type A sorting domain-containing protein n=1 Tax=uncultured Tenacibaculum sp. TaxID=174713 RepID=UPI002607E7ED|nr:T9SS type A sorting domain-containing protein [uncultured Tenacibaculum sp.]